MIKRVIDISEQAYLHVLHSQLCVEKNDIRVATIPIEDLGILILQHPGIVITQSVVTRCQKNNTAILFCDERHLPISITLPLWTGHSLHTKVLREQLSASVATQKRLWQQVVRAKITEQALTLESLDRNAIRLRRLVAKVRSGDPDNCEAQAAIEYWKRLMGNDFRRDVNADGINALLNYGYAVVRAMVARAIVGTGLHPAMGLHHKNQYNGLCLADDMMEPLRPWVDAVVYNLETAGAGTGITQQSKELLLGILGQDVVYKKKKMPLMTSMHYVASELKQALNDRSISLSFPQRPPCGV